MENELIIVNGELTSDFVDEYIEFCKYRDMVKAKEEEFKNALKKAMNDEKIYKISNDKISISYTPETTKETFDSKKFKEDYPALYDQYVKVSKVSGALRITIKEEKDG